MKRRTNFICYEEFMTNEYEKNEENLKKVFNIKFYEYLKLKKIFDFKEK